MVEDRLIRVDDLVVSITWKRAKSIRLWVTPPGGDVAVSAPLGVPPERIRRFIQEQRPWINREHDQLRDPTLGVDRLEDGGRTRLWGRWYDVGHRREGRAHIWIAGRRLITTGEDEAARGRAITRSRRSEMGRVSRLLLDSWVPVMGVPRPVVIRYHAMHARWGSCNHRTRAITLDTTLVRFPVAALEYVIVHELAHLRHADHDRGFWSLVMDTLPDHDERKRLLSAYIP